MLDLTTCAHLPVICYSTITSIMLMKHID